MSPEPIDLAQAALRRSMESALVRDDPFELQDLVLRVAEDADDLEWAQICCARLARHRDAHVRGNAVQGFGSLARRFGQLDAQRVKRLVEIALFDLHEYVADKAECAATDIETFLRWRFDRP